MPSSATRGGWPRARRSRSSRSGSASLSGCWFLWAMRCSVPARRMSALCTALRCAMLRVLDLFCGACGGWSLGLHRAGGSETVAACEIDDWRRERFRRNFPEAVTYRDVRELHAGQLRADGVVPDVIVGSPPCQDASSANARGKGLDGERT